MQNVLLFQNELAQRVDHLIAFVLENAVLAWNAQFIAEHLPNVDNIFDVSLGEAVKATRTRFDHCTADYTCSQKIS